MRALGTGQEALKSDICAERKSDMSKIRADNMTEVHAKENKMGNSMSVIREEFKTQISDLCAGQTELEERLDKQEKNVTSAVEQLARSLRKEFKAQLAAVEARSRRAVGGGPGAGTTKLKHQNLTIQNPGQCFTHSLRPRQCKITGCRVRKLLIF